jgi:hypothetical protein
MIEFVSVGLAAVAVVAVAVDVVRDHRRRRRSGL